MRRGLTLSCLAAALVAPAAAAGTPCSERLIADWAADSRVDHAYHLACYRDALDTMPEDLRTYSSAPADIGAAMHRRVRRLEGRRIAAPDVKDSRDGHGRVVVVALMLLAGSAVLVAASLRR
ncbi:MAG: hypothetical protein ABR521_09505 [Gaiellaceae bacterium]